MRGDKECKNAKSSVKKAFGGEWEQETNKCRGKDRNDINCPNVRTHLKQKKTDDDKAGGVIGEDGDEVDRGI